VLRSEVYNSAELAVVTIDWLTDGCCVLSQHRYKSEQLKRKSYENRRSISTDVTRAGLIYSNYVP
jgi:hypothetical protein